MTTYTLNHEFNGIEITFDSKPADEIRSTLKENGFRWHKVKKLWYAKQNEKREELAKQICNGEVVKAEPKKPAAKAKKKNKYGVKVGDLFHASWGYEQTNNDFFQVVELVGATSVRVREVYPSMINEEAVSPMSADRTYKNTGELLPPVPRSVFIDDQEKGDLKRLKSYAADGVSDPQFRISSYADASLVKGDRITVYDSWYY